MTLYLHIGTEKTGSSFLQSYLANNRALLERHSVYYPTAGVQEANMLKGIITPGNASELNVYLQNESWSSVKKWLKAKQNDAKTKGCTSLLLSNEILSITFSKEDVLQSFLDITKSLGLECQDMLLMIREPVSQALSLYKHRSKEGVMLPINQWLQEKYILADSLIEFYNQLEKSNFSILQYPYQKNSEYLVDVCINKWLQLNEQIKVEHKSVNPSLTLSELNLLCDIYDEDQILSNKYYDFMLKIDSKLKSKDEFLTGYIKNHINNFMVGYNYLWKTAHSYMSCETPQFEYQPVEIKDSNNMLSFSPEQIKTISTFVSYASSFKFFRHKQLIRIKKAIIKVTPNSLIELRKKLLYR